MWINFYGIEQFLIDIVKLENIPKYYVKRRAAKKAIRRKGLNEVLKNKTYYQHKFVRFVEPYEEPTSAVSS